MYAGHIQINSRHRIDRGTYSHELAHVLGFDHPAGLDAVSSRSIMRRGRGPEPTPIDVSIAPLQLVEDSDTGRLNTSFQPPPRNWGGSKPPFPFTAWSWTS